MQIIHKKKQAWLFGHGTHGIFAGPLAADAIQYWAQVSGAQEWIGW